MTNLRHLSSLSIALALAINFSGCATSSKNAPATRTEQISKLLKKADQSHGDPSKTVGLSLSAAESALALATDKSASAVERTTALHIYNAAVADCVVALRKLESTPSDAAIRTFSGATTRYQVRIISAGQSFLKNPATFNRLIEAGKIARKHLKSNVQRDGIGAPFVGVIEKGDDPLPNQSPNGFAEPLTAIAKFKKSAWGTTPVELFFFDPREKEKITLSDTTFQLRGDFTAPLAYFPPVREMLFGFIAMMRSDKVMNRSGIYMLEPYDPNKTPVLFVHGLMSSPQAWINFINELNHDPEFRRHYQGMWLFYPSGGPIAANALRFRQDLAALAALYPLKHNLIIVGHSMGGILTRMQVTNTDQRLWNSVFGAKAKSVDAMVPKDAMMRKALVFKANPEVSRVIFFSTPHRGSKLADLRISSLAGSLIRMPVTLVKTFNRQMRSIVQLVDPSVRSIPSSIQSLSPKSPLLKGVSELPIAVPYHSIIGNQGLDQKPIAESSDGVVPYWSSHVDGAKSELIVPTGHNSFDNPASVVETLRILKLEE